MEDDGTVVVNRSVTPNLITLAASEEENPGSTNQPNIGPSAKELIKGQMDRYVKSSWKLLERWGVRKNTPEWGRNVLIEYIPLIIKFLGEEENEIKLGSTGYAKIHDFIYRETKQTRRTYTVQDTPKTLGKIEYTLRFLRTNDFMEREERTYNLVPTEKLSRLEKIMFS